MKKYLMLCMAALVAVSLQNCTKDDGADDGKTDDDGKTETPVDPGTSIQAATKIIEVPAENFPAIDIYNDEGPVESFSLMEGNFKATRNGTEFNGDEFATGVKINEGDIITIEQNGVKLIEFAPKTGGAGTKIRLGGIGSTSDLTSAEGLGRGIYEFYVPAGAADETGMLKGGTIYTDGNENDKATMISLEGGVDYLMRRDHFSGEVGAEGWAVAPADLGQGFTCDNSQAISIYPASALNDANVKPLYSARPLASSGMWDFRLERFVKKVADDNSDFYYRVQGCGEIKCWFRVGNGVNSSDFDTQCNGLSEETGNPDPWARVFGPSIRFALYVCDHSTDLTEDDLATPEQINAFISEAGLDPGANYVIMKVLNYETEVNTAEPMEFVWKRKSPDATNKIRFEGVAYDEQNNCIVLTAGMTVRSSNAEGAFS